MFCWRRIPAIVLVTLVLMLVRHPSVAAEPQQATTPVALDQKIALGLSQAAVGTQPGDFAFQNRDGRTVRLSDFRGKPLLVSFIYTGCFQVCPTTTKSLHSAVEDGRGVFGTSQFNVVSIGFNLPSDSPQALKAFAKQYRIDAPNWDFLSPAAADVESLTKAFGFSYLANPAGFDHILQATLLDANGRINRQIYGEALNAESIGGPIRELLTNTPSAQRFSMDELLDRVRILCTVYDPQTGRYDVKYGLLIEVAGGVTFAVAMAWFFIAEWLSQRRRRRRLFLTKGPLV